MLCSPRPGVHGPRESGRGVVSAQERGQAYSAVAAWFSLAVFVFLLVRRLILRRFAA